MNNILDCQDSVRVRIKHIKYSAAIFEFSCIKSINSFSVIFPSPSESTFETICWACFSRAFRVLLKQNSMRITINMQWDLYRMKMPSLKLPPPWPMGLSFGSGCISFISLYVISWGFVSNSLIISRLSISPSLSRSILLKISWYLSWFTGDSELCLNVQ